MSPEPNHLVRDIGILLERTLNLQADVAEIKELVRLQNGRVVKLESQMAEIGVYRKVAIGISAVVGSVGAMAAQAIWQWAFK